MAEKVMVRVVVAVREILRRWEGGEGRGTQELRNNMRIRNTGKGFMRIFAVALNVTVLPLLFFTIVRERER